ncbi:MAG: PDZ domain-containing protein [Planctomycetaceae bacterium]|nr:PDZ domain-containing protein [Planctomycetaceae bacterium]
MNKQILALSLTGLSLAVFSAWAWFLHADQEQPPSPADSYWIGVGVVPVPDVLLPHFGVKEGTGGLAVIDSVVPDSPAAKAGLKRGDVLLSFGKKDIHSLADLVEQIAQTKDQPQTATVMRNGTKTELTVTPAKRPAARNPLRSGHFTPDFRVPNLPPQLGTRFGDRDFWLTPQSPQKMMREMEEYFRQMQGGMDNDFGLILPDDADSSNGTAEKNLSVSSITENGQTKIKVKQILRNGQTTEEKSWEAGSIEELPEEIRNEIKMFNVP